MILLLVVLGLYVAILLAVTALSRRPPRIPIFVAPGAFGSPQEEVQIPSTDGITLQGWWVDAPKVKTVAIFLHGYAMNRAELAPVAFRFWQLGMASLMIDFRAHGRTRAGTSTIGWKEREDVRAACLWVRERMPGAKIVLIGSSMGSAAAGMAVGDDPDIADAVVLDSSYSKLSHAIPGWWRFLGGRFLQIVLAPVVWLAIPIAKVNPYRVDVAERLKQAHRVPFLVLHGEADDLAPPAEAERNLAALPEGTKIVWFPRSGHSEGRWIHPHLYESAVLGFLETHGLWSREYSGTKP